MTRERDALIAEKVLKLPVRKVLVSEWVRGRDYADVGDYVIDWDTHSSAGLCPEYSTDLNFAWQAADAFCTRYGCTVTVERVSAAWEAQSGQRYVATVSAGALRYADFGGEFRAESNAGTADALCRVLLMAVEAQV